MDSESRTTLSNICHRGQTELLCAEHVNRILTQQLFTHRIQSRSHCGFTSCLPTVGFKIHAAKDERTDVLGLHVALEVDKDGGQVVVGVVGDAGGGDGLEELGLRELSGQHAQVLVYQGAQRDAGGDDEVICLKNSVAIHIFCRECLIFLTYPGL